MLLDNIPEFWFTLCGAALAGATVVGINPTRRGAELRNDIAHADCAFVLTEARHRELFEDTDALVVDDPAWFASLAAFAGAPLPETCPAPTDPFMLIFTSGTTAFQGRSDESWPTGDVRGQVAGMFGLGPDDVFATRRCRCSTPTQRSPGSRTSSVWRDGRPAGAGSRRRSSCPTCGDTA